MPTDNAANINTNAQQPKSASNDTGSVEMNSIPDQIAADRYEQSKASAGGKKRGIILAKFRKQGTV